MAEDSTVAGLGTAQPRCRWCGAYHGPACPIVHALEFDAYGTVMRVEFRASAVDELNRPQGETHGAYIRKGDKSGT